MATTERSTSRGVWIACSLVLGLFVAAVAYSATVGSFEPFSGMMLIFPVIGFVVLHRQPDNTIGWVMVGIGAVGAVAIGLGAYAHHGLRLTGSLPGAAVAQALVGGHWAPAIGLPGTFLLLLFPDGHPPSRRWRVVGWLAGIGIGGTVLFVTLWPGPFEAPLPPVQNPLGIEALRPVTWIAFVFIFMIPISIVLSAISLVVRFRRSTGVERQQLKWLTAASATVALLYTASFLTHSDDPSTAGAIFQGFAIFSFVLIPIAIGVAILKYRLYDIDLVINKALVYGSMAAFITAVYVAIVVGIGRAIGSDRNIALSILATALVAVAFQPVRGRVQRFANRLVYGKRATPYEVLSQFSGGMSHAVATEELLPGMARIVAEGSGATRADVWLHVGSELVREATWPEGNGHARTAVAVAEPPDPEILGADAAIAVRHQGELLGVIGVKKSPGEAVSAAETKLLEDLASQAGLVLRNVRLIEELRTSRQRLVTAQDGERRRLERDLHDGAQQRLVAISLALRMARGMVRPDANPDLGSRIDQAAEQLTQALAELREFARGIHPAILTERGLAPALQSLAERATVPTTVEASLEDRLPAAVEATAYFLVSEALANVGKYAKATAVTVRADAAGGELTVEVADDGIGGADEAKGSGLRGLGDRVAAVDGMLDIHSPPGEGTRLTVRIPVPAMAEVTV